MTDRVKCSNQDCDNMVLSATAQRTGGKCVACLTDAEADRLMKRLCDLADRGDTEPACAIAVALLRTRAYDLTPLHEKLLEYQLDDGPDYPGFLFLSAAPEVRDELVNRVAENPDCVLQALAWVGDKQVVEQFARWRANRPAWAKKLYVPPHDYTYSAGWELTAHGTKRELVFNTCFALVPVEVDDPKVPICVLSDAQERCPFCQAELTNLLHFRGDVPEVTFLPQYYPGLRFLTCLFCACLAKGLGSEIGGGAKGLVPIGKFPGKARDNRDEINLVGHFRLEKSPRRPYFACESPGEKGISQIGGHPAWVHDASYPNCPSCENTMHFAAQVSVADVEPGKGIYYAFLCGSCRRYSVVSYQQP